MKTSRRGTGALISLSALLVCALLAPAAVQADPGRDPRGGVIDHGPPMDGRSLGRGDGDRTGRGRGPGDPRDRLRSARGPLDGPPRARRARRHVARLHHLYPAPADCTAGLHGCVGPDGTAHGHF